MRQGKQNGTVRLSPTKTAARGDGPSPDYAFAHYAIRHIALSDPLQFLAIAASTEVERFIEAVLQDVQEQCERKTSFDACEVKVHTTRAASYPCAVLEMPEPTEVAEVFMVALVVFIDTSTEPPSEMDEIPARYFTLEKGFSLSDEPRTVLAEWDTESHFNYGNGPAATVEAFIGALDSHLNRS